MARGRPLFLERASYRRRRLGDAARVLPVLSLILLLLPVCLTPVLVSYAGGALWLFGLWAGLIVLTALLQAALARAEAATHAAEHHDQDEGDDDAG